mmetsp:Transcript_56244/g.137950  ORF Transcript_56244/g.137950 Transcript_56244/m.137950 type:complete len:743 (+) Transcript_56244:81-2309(+)
MRRASSGSAGSEEQQALLSGQGANAGKQRPPKGKSPALRVSQSPAIPIKLGSTSAPSVLGTSPGGRGMLSGSPRIGMGTSPHNSSIRMGTSPGMGSRLSSSPEFRHIPALTAAAAASEALPPLSSSFHSTQISDKGSDDGSVRSVHSLHGSVVASGNPYDNNDSLKSFNVADLREKREDPSLMGAASNEPGANLRAMEVDKPREPEEPRVSCWHPTRFPYKATVLFLQCMLTFGSFYCYDIPGALKGRFFKRFPGLTQFDYNLMYSLYSWPNTVQVFFGGYIIDKYVGVRWGCLICALLGLGGQLLVTIGVQTESLPTVLVGRFIFGMGGETLCVAQSAYVAKWFKGSELATAFGICLSFSRLGSAVNFDLSPAVASMDGPYGGFVAAEWWGVGMTIVSLVCCMTLNAMDVHADKLKEREKLAERERFDSVMSDDEEPEEEVSLSDIWTFGADVWILFLICISFYASVFVFLQNGVQFIKQRYDMTEQNAAFLMSLPYSISALACPVFGYLVDQTGRALVWVFLSTSLLGFLHFSFAFNPAFQAWMGVSMMGISYSVCAAALWPCIAIVVELNKLGTAYGLMTAFQNLGLAVFPLLIADLLPEDDANFSKEEFEILYGPVMTVFAACGATGAGLTVVLFFLDLRTGGWLNASATALLERDEREEREEKEALEAKRKAAEETETAALLPDVHIHISHQRGRYLSRLGIRPAVSIHGGPRPFSTKPGHFHSSPFALERHYSAPV